VHSGACSLCVYKSIKKERSASYFVVKLRYNLCQGKKPGPKSSIIYHSIVLGISAQRMENYTFTIRMLINIYCSTKGVSNVGSREI